MTNVSGGIIYILHVAECAFVLSDSMSVHRVGVSSAESS